MDKIWKTKNDSRKANHFCCYSTFLGPLGLESAKDLPGLKELKSAGLLASTIPNIKDSGADIDKEDPDLSDNMDQPELFVE